MDNSLHYLIMANQMLVQKALLDKLKVTGLTIGQPKILDYLKDHDGSILPRAALLKPVFLPPFLTRWKKRV